MCDCLQTVKASQNQNRPLTDIKVNSAFDPFRVGKSSTGLAAWR